MTGNLEFPAGFVWGATTAAYQVEGAVDDGGRGLSIWDTFSRTPGRTLNGDTGDISCCHYEKWAEDVALMGRLGLGAYRFSIAWPRVQPDGKGQVNRAGLDFYRRLVDGLRDQGIVPVATLYHWDLPQALEDGGGWTVRGTAERFADYASLVAEALGDGVGMWITVNEPFCASWLGYGVGLHAPGKSNPHEAAKAAHHLLLGHGWAAAAVRGASRSPVGITLNTVPLEAASDHELDLAAARLVDGCTNRYFLSPVFKAEYPEDVFAVLAGEPRPGWLQPGDMHVISAPLDFLGVNYYRTVVVAHTSRLEEARRAGYVSRPGDVSVEFGSLQANYVERPALERTALGWEVDPAGMTAALVRVRDEYSGVPLYVTENGAVYHDYRGPDGAVHDPQRIRYLKAHVGAVRVAIEEGVDVRGYFVWSLMDNFEWDSGYSKRFGLVWVDYPTGERVPKDSYEWYRQVIATNGLPPG